MRSHPILAPPAAATTSPARPPQLRAAILSVLFTLLLGACSDRSPLAPVPAPPTPGRAVLGVVEVTFEASSSGVVTASARSLSLPPGLRFALGGAPVSEGSSSGIQLRGAARGLTDLAGTRYLSATFDVRNAGSDGAAYAVSHRNVTFVAVTSPATIAETPLTVLQRFDGSGYSDPTQRDQIARGILPTHAMAWESGSLGVVEGMADFQALREDEVAPLASASLHPLAYGFVVRCVQSCADGRTLTASPAVDQFDGRVTFAVKLPLQASPTDNPFRFSMLFLAVEDADARVTESVEEQGTSGVQARADALPGSVVTLLGNTSTVVGGHAVERVCRVRTAGDDPNAPLATLVNAGSPCSAAGELPTNVRVVNAVAAPGGDGTTWATAFRSLQDALTCVRAGGTCTGVAEVWVAEGTYYPDDGAGITDGAASATFSLIPGVGLYGGFAGNEYARSQRDWSAHATLLSGDVDDNDAHVPAQTVLDIVGANSAHVVTAAGTAAQPITSGTVLDGFTINAGWNPFSGGGGILCSSTGTGGSCSPVLRNLTVSANLSALFISASGGATSSPQVWNSVFGENDGISGGALLVQPGPGSSAQVLLAGVSFIHNSADVRGGAIRISCTVTSAGCAATLINTSFLSDSARQGAGAIHVDASSTSPVHLAVVNTTFRDIRSGASGAGGLAAQLTGTANVSSFTNVTMQGSHSASGLNALYQAGGSASIVNSVFWGNTASEVVRSSGTMEVRESTIASGCPAGAACTGVSTTDPLFVNAAAGDLRLQPASTARDAGDTGALPFDTWDLDGDGDTSERLPIDLGGKPRLVDYLQPGSPRVDRGAFEVQ